MAVGRFYVKSQHYLAAINRFKTVVDKYGDTTNAPEALFRLTEAYTALGLRDEAKKTAAVLGYNYPGSDWYEDAYMLAGFDRSVRDERRAAAQAAEDEKPWWSLW